MFAFSQFLVVFKSTFDYFAILYFNILFMKTCRIVLVVLFFVFGLVGCSQSGDIPGDESSDSMEGANTDTSAEVVGDEEVVVDDTAVLPVADSKVIASGDREARKEEIRNKILKDRQTASAGSQNAVSPAQLASTGSAFPAFLVLSVFMALVYVGVRRKYAQQQRVVERNG